MKKIQGIFKPIPILLIVLAFPLALAAQIGYRYIRGTGTATSVTCWSDTFTVRDCTDAEITAAGGFIDGSGTANFIPKFSDSDTLTDSTLSNSGAPAAGAGGNILAHTAALTAMNGSDTVNGVTLNFTNANHTGTGNTFSWLAFSPAANIEGDANSNLNAISIAALTGTTGAAGEIEAAINIGSGWDAGVYCPSGCTIDGDITIGTNDVDDITVKGPITYKVVREDFNGIAGQVPWHGEVSSLGSSPVFTDAAQNFWYVGGSQLAMIYNRFEQACGGCPPPFQDGYLFWDTDDTAAEGNDIGFGGPRFAAASANGTGALWDEDAGISAYCEVSVLVTDISETDSFYFGWSLEEAVIDAGNYAGGNTYAYFVIQDAAGDLDIETELNGGGTLNDDTGVTWADGEEKVLRVTISADSVTFTLDGSAVTQTNAVLNFDDGDRAECVAGYLNGVGDGTPDPDIKFGYVEIGVSQ